MECILFIGIQASGKSTFYKEKFFNTHIRINLDMLKTRHREDIYVAASIEAKQPFVVDNTNPTPEDRKKYIEAAKRGRFKVAGYYFEPDYAESMKRNELRAGTDKIPEIGIKSVLKKLTPPDADEGFDELYKVITQNGKFIVSEL
ncbi:kinase [Paenibacillus elgii]|uniref:Kinase n=1 Tax=Paenibacillus elgii TaxID=189691 RepID=A0A2T6G4B9_9BACL|nr:AAA family ATPase [Paenibacillus elgii]PUA39006.1 kinase [Paenibacillus elgii]